jgi:hypothetical protein
MGLAIIIMTVKFTGFKTSRKKLERIVGDKGDMEVSILQDVPPDFRDDKNHEKSDESDCDR